jgi:coproporphyrinogen III oxidase
MDLTPYYPFTEDIRHFHATCRQALLPFGDDTHARYKKWCDEYFFLKHRNEPRGVGGVFFDDLDEGGFERCFALTRAVGDAFIDAYLPLIESGRLCRMANASVTSRPTGADVTSSSIWSGIVARCSACNRVDEPSRS